MVFTSEETKILDKAAEILAWHVVIGDIKKELFDLYTSMIELTADDIVSIKRNLECYPVEGKALSKQAKTNDYDPEILQAVLDGFPSPESVIKFLKVYFTGTFSEAHLISVIEDYADEDLLKFVLENHYIGISITEGILNKIIDNICDTELFKYVLKNHYSGKLVTEDILNKIIDEYYDEDILKYVLKNHFSGQYVSESFIQKVKDEFDDSNLTSFVKRNYYRR